MSGRSDAGEGDSMVHVPEGVPEYEAVNNCVLPTHLRYCVEEDMWLHEGRGGVVTVGMTDTAQTIAGSIMHAHYLVGPGDHREEGRNLMTLESAKWMGAVEAPFGGEVVEVNDAVSNDAYAINRSPYREVWLFRMEPDDPGEVEEKFVPVDEAEERYAEKMDEEDLDNCVHCEEFEI